VVDSSDLPLNISRELLQQNPLLEKIKKDVTKSVLKALEAMKTEEYDKYVGFYRELGAVLKEGLGRDWANRERLADLLLFESMKTEAGKYLTLAQYVAAMPADQKDIYYLIGESRELLAHSPFLEAFRARGQDVLLLTDPVDEFVIPGLAEYKGKRLKAVDGGDVEDDKSAEAKQAEDARFQPLLELLKSRLSEVSDVRLSSRLKESAACLVAGEGAMSAHLERLMQRMGRGTPPGESKRILELNGEHPAVVAMQKLFEKDRHDARVESFARLLYDQAVIAEGSKVKDPGAFAQRVNELLVKAAEG
jgi:molecular chaperone HtpG